MIVDLVDGLEFEAPMKFRVYLEFHIEETGIQQVIFMVTAVDHAAAFKAAMTLKDNDFPGCKLKDINIYAR